MKITSFNQLTDAYRMEKPLSDSDVQAQGSKFDIQILEEASYLLWYIWRGTDPAYSKLQDCIAALDGDAELYNALKAAHVVGQYAVIRQWESAWFAISLYSVLLMPPQSVLPAEIRLMTIEWRKALKMCCERFGL